LTLHGLGNQTALVLRDGDIAQRGDDALARQALGIAEGFDELDERGALDGLGAEKHRPEGSGKYERV